MWKSDKKRVAVATLSLKTGNDISSHKASLVVFSALKVFTSVFGMRTGVSPSLISPVMAECSILLVHSQLHILNLPFLLT